MSTAIQGKIEFDADGWYGIIADDFTFENIWQIARAIAIYLDATYARDRPVLIGYDTRFLADRFAHSAAEILTDFGRTVKIVARDCPTPVLVERIRSIDSAGGLMFAASHKPAKYCGIKYITDNGTLATTDTIDRIVANLDKADNSPPSGKNSYKIDYFDPKSDYLKYVYNLLNIDALRGATLKVKYDAIYSTSRGYLNEILDHCGIDLESFNTQRDVLFGGGMIEANEKNLQQLTESVKKDKADLGLVVGDDSTLFAVADDRGRVIPSQDILLVLSRYLSQKKLPMESIANDGILASMLVVEAVAVEGKPLSQLVEEAIER